MLRCIRETQKPCVVSLLIHIDLLHSLLLAAVGVPAQSYKSRGCDDPTSGAISEIMLRLRENAWKTSVIKQFMRLSSKVLLWNCCIDKLRPDKDNIGAQSTEPRTISHPLAFLELANRAPGNGCRTPFLPIIIRGHTSAILLGIENYTSLACSETSFISS